MSLQLNHPSAHRSHGVLTALTVGLLLAFFLASLSGCAYVRAWDAAQPSSKEAVAPYHEEALYNFALAREYQAEGRYELARERLLLALAVARDETFKLRLAQEVEAVDRMLLAKR